MSTMTEVAGSQSVSNYFDPSEEKSRSKLARGVYPAHIIKCDKPKTVEFKGYKALIYNYVIKVDNAVTRHNFQVEDIDGVLKDATHLRNAVPSQISQGSHNVGIGFNYNGSASYPYPWDGAIDELSMWDVELTADQVSYLYGGGAVPDVSKGIP